MTRIACQRTWQVEAARDGRLAGSDLSNALRHRSECADCKQAARALDELGLRLKALQVTAPDALAHRRSRHALLSAWNSRLVAEPRPRANTRVLLTVALCAISGVALAIGVSRTRTTRQAVTAAHTSQLGFEPKERAVRMPEPSSSIKCPPQTPLPAAENANPAPSAAAKGHGMRGKPMTLTDTAEDDAYLQIVELLRAGREREARAQAAQYLLRFPHGFRRVEVARIAER